MKQILPLVIYPDDRLKQICTPVTEFNENLIEFVNDMFATQYKNEGIGLAAPQVGVLKRIITIDIDNNPIVLINPEIIEKQGLTAIEEGCLSIPDVRAKVDRFAELTVKAQNVKGEFFELKADDLLAICIQHEIDHINGVLFIDYLSPLKRSRIKQKMLKYKKALQNAKN